MVLNLNIRVSIPLGIGWVAMETFDLLLKERRLHKISI